MAQNDDLTRRDVMKLAGAAGITAAAVTTAATVAGPGFVKAHAQSNQIRYGLIGTGSRGTYLLSRLAKIDNGHCAALCDLDANSLDKAASVIGTNPKKYNDYRELLADKNVDAVIVAVPLYEHFPVTRDALQAGKHVFCEKSLVFKPEEVHALRGLAPQHGKQVLQVGLQRRYSHYFQATRQMVEKGILGDVTHIHAMWHRNPGWVMRPGGKSNPRNWRLFREFSGGLTAELASHQVDVADWMFGAQPEFVMGLGGLDTWKNDGRDIFDNIQLIFQYPGGRKMTFSATISTKSPRPIKNCLLMTPKRSRRTITRTASVRNTGATAALFVMTASAEPHQNKYQPARLPLISSKTPYRPTNIQSVNIMSVLPFLPI
jgi:predicted dehydrogenase